MNEKWKKSFRVIDISWSERRKLAYSDKSESYELSSVALDACISTGFYAIYGRHPTYGPETLLYIGQSNGVNEEGRTILCRLKEHTGNGRKFWYFQDLSVSIGMLYENLCKDDIEAVESILIASSKPAMNIQQIYAAKESAKDILVRNWDFYGDMTPECSGEYWNQ